MQDKIIAFLKQEKGKRFTIQTLSEALDYTKAEDYKNLAIALNTLEEQAIIIANEHYAYTLLEFTRYVKGTLDVKAKGFAFLRMSDEDTEDIYIAKHLLKDAMHQDTVLAKVESSPKGLKKEAEVVRVLARNFTHIIGTLVKRNDRYQIISDHKSITLDIVVAEDDLNGAKVYDKVQAKIISYRYQNQMTCRVSQIIGAMNAPGVDILSKVFQYNIDPIFPEIVINEAKQFKALDTDEIKNREDYRDRFIITIDGEDAKDFDDAVEVYQKDNGHFYLAVHIADVAHYVREKSALDKEAYRRGTSIYLVDRVIPMLPENLSNHLCSLMPNVDRFVMSIEMDIDASGRVKDYRIFPSVICSKARTTYTQVNALLNDSNAHNDDLLKMLQMMATLSNILHIRRTKKGSINFETEEANITLDDQGKAIDITLRTRGTAERMIEEMMLIANQTVAAHLSYMQLPSIYRVHDAPKEEKLNRLLSMANAFGFGVNARKEISHKELQKLLQKVKNTASEKGMNLMMLRSMQKAVYTTHNIGHFGLAFEHYTHFTSPIRRYPDLMVHRLIKRYYNDSENHLKTIAHFESILPTIADHASLKERAAVQLERDVLDMKKAEYMGQFIGDTFEGHISGVTSFGIYVSLANTIEGLVHISELNDDYYEFDEDFMRLIGRRKKKQYRMGDPVKIKVSSVNILEGQIDFVLGSDIS